jgi:hypothetical protein
MRFMNAHRDVVCDRQCHLRLASPAAEPSPTTATAGERVSPVAGEVVQAPRHHFQAAHILASGLPLDVMRRCAASEMPAIHEMIASRCKAFT